MRTFNKILLIFSILACYTITNAQDQGSIYDYGKMWTFEHAPVKYFQETYKLENGQEWFDHARQSALKFASWCSASFVSPNGLIMTNHHCSEGEISGLNKEGEDLLSNGFVAEKLEDERRREDLFVEQLKYIVDITDVVKAEESKVKSHEEKMKVRKETLKKLEVEYQGKKGWEDFRIETVTFYSGGKFSLYAYKKYTDIRLVFVPEAQLGFFGGDSDNFTYPRYNLDCTFWRAYENGKPANTSKHYFKINLDGVKEGEPVFVIGNPGSTERYRTVAQLEFDRDVRYNYLVDALKDYYVVLEKEYKVSGDDAIRSKMFGVANSIKAISGIVEGLENEVLINRKRVVENQIKSSFKGEDYWKELGDIYGGLKNHATESFFLSPSGLNGEVIGFMHQLEAYGQLVQENDVANMKLQKEKILQMGQGLSSDENILAFGKILQKLKDNAEPGDKYLDVLMGEKSGLNVAKQIFDKTKIGKKNKLEKLLKSEKFVSSKDPFLKATRLLMSAYSNSFHAFQSTAAKRNELEGKIAKAAFDVNGTSLPPDATFTLRISDGIVDGYNYNGTRAPYKTTFYGMYNRHYAHEGKKDWALPDRWMNPPAELLKAPFNFVSTNDIIGGNSGSVIINGKGEAVGLIFDGNIESLPGNFIFVPEKNRAVSVHIGGIYAALKYIYKADRLVKEFE